MRGSRPFCWLLEKRHRRSSLRAVESALRSGRLALSPPEHRAALVETVGKLLSDPDGGELDVSGRERIRLMRILLTMGAMNVGVIRPRDRPRAFR